MNDIITENEIHEIVRAGEDEYQPDHRLEEVIITKINCIPDYKNELKGVMIKAKYGVYASAILFIMLCSTIFYNLTETHKFQLENSDAIDASTFTLLGLFILFVLSEFVLYGMTEPERG